MEMVYFLLYAWKLINDNITIIKNGLEKVYFDAYNWGSFLIFC